MDWIEEQGGHDKREQRRYEIAREVLAGMMPDTHDVCQTFDFNLRARAAVDAADALLAALAQPTEGK